MQEVDTEPVPPIPPLQRIRSAPLRPNELVKVLTDEIACHCSVWDGRVEESSVLSDRDTASVVKIADKIPSSLPHFLASTDVVSRVYQSSTTNMMMQTEIELYNSEKVKVSVCHLALGTRTVTRKANATEIFVCVFGNIAVKGVRVHSDRKYRHFEQSYDEVAEKLSDIKDCDTGLNVGEKISLTSRRPVVIARGAYFCFKAEAESMYLKIEQLFPVSEPSVYAWNGTILEPEDIRGAPRLMRWEKGSRHSKEVAESFVQLISEHNSRTSSVTNMDMALFRPAFKDSFYFRCQKLSALMKEKKTPCLIAGHSESVKSIRDSLCLWMLHDGSVAPESPDEWARLKPRTILNVEGGIPIEVMKRLVLFEDDTLQIRMHLFPDGAETFIHNHSGSCFSVCLRGQYTHHTWICDESKKACSYTKRERTSGGGLTPLADAEQCVGEIRKGESFVHDELNTYFLHCGSFHTVETPKVPNGESSGGVLTIFFRDKCKTGKTFVLTPTSSESVELGDGREDEIVDDELTQFINKVDSYIIDAGKMLRQSGY